MDREFLVQNIKRLCALRGVKPTVACRESGAGKDFLNNIEKQSSVPSVEKVQLFAQYLGVTTSELLGEESKNDEQADTRTDADLRAEFTRYFQAASPEKQNELLGEMLRMIQQQGK